MQQRKDGQAPSHSVRAPARSCVKHKPSSLLPLQYREPERSPTSGVKTERARAPGAAHNGDRALGTNQGTWGSRVARPAPS